MEKYNECIFEETDLDQIFKEEEMSEYDINMNNYLENDSKIEDKNPDSENIRTKTLDNNFIISKNKNSNKKNANNNIRLFNKTLYYRNKEYYKYN